ncbi:MAG: RNA polymerase sigma-70 factor [Prolixibacteraceae bacterium]
MSSAAQNTIPEEKKFFLDFQGGSQVCFDYFFEKYYQGLCVYAFKILKSNSEAEDLVQDFFVRLLEKRKTIQITDSVKSYFLRSVHNRCLDYLAHQKVVASHESYRLRMMSEEDFQEYPLLDVELKQKIETAIRNLPDSIRETFMLNRFDGLSYHEIASRENVSVKTVEYRISKALGILRLELGDYLLLAFFISRF